MTARDPVTIVLLGEPLAWARTRISRTGALFMAPVQRNATAALRMAAQDAMISADATVLDGPLSLELLAEFRIPVGWSRRRHGAAMLGEIRPAKRPDLDNIYKLAADAMQGIVYTNDAQIVDMRCRKIYGIQPKIVCTISPVLPAVAVTERPAELPLVVAA